VDNVCHTLAGAAFAAAGLKRATALSRATLVIAANLPDIDVLAFASDTPWVAFRRGWTHGVVAQAVLPILLAAVMFAFGRRRGARFGPLVGLSAVGVLSHVALDLLNNYGVRLLMPFSGRWFYGDSVFIVDIWLWLTLGAGCWLAFTRDRDRPARVALVVASCYIVAMVVSAPAARENVRDGWRARHGREPQALMVGPVPITPFRRMVIVDAGETYATGTFDWFSRTVRFDDERLPKNDRHPSVRAAIASDERIQAVLIWARFPYYEIQKTPSGDAVTLRDVRFGNRVGGVRAVVGGSPGS
jgi:inner membrane protein